MDNGRSVCILWHCHQPCYRDALTGEVLLPWVRLHAARAYAEMPRRLLEAEGARATFNLTPVLTDQMDACRRGASDPLWTALGKRAEDLDEKERRLCLKTLFSVQGRALERWEGYRLLGERLAGPDAHLAASAEQLRNLQAWFLLAWCGPTLLDEPWIAGLRARGGGFSETDKRELMDRIDAEVAAVKPAFLDAQASGRSELSASPYYHPILPLLADARQADPAPGVEPPLVFAQPEDARIQIVEACAAHARYWGKPPAGVWPSEGAVSPAALAAIAAAPIRWVVTDQAILRQTLALEKRDPAPSDFLTPHRVATETEGEGKEMAVFFRDTFLSDLIGFEYANWPDPDRAAEDLVGRIDAIPSTGARLECVTLALDGENAWGYYGDGGRPFLRALYRRLAGHPRLRMRTLSEHLEAAGGIGALPRLRTIGTGSWIHASLGTWAATPDQRRAWGFLSQARARCGKARGLDALHLAEGSDWFWWLSGDHHTEMQDLFVRLFTSAVRQACRQAAAPEPEGLSAWAARLGGGNPA